jgi:hypothetical protein
LCSDFSGRAKPLIMLKPPNFIYFTCSIQTKYILW